MKASIATLVLALSGSALAAPFKYNGTSIANSTYIHPASSGRPTPSPLSTDPPLPNPFASSTSLPLPTSTPVFGSKPASIIPSKRGEDLSIPTDLPSFVSDAQSVAAAFASGAQKRGDDLSLPTDLPSFISDAQSVAAALASGGAQKRQFPFSSASTGTPVTPTATPSTTPVTPTGTVSATPSLSSASLSIPFTPSSSKPVPTTTGFSLFGFPFA